MQNISSLGRPKVLIKSDFDRYPEWKHYFSRFNMDIVRWEDRQKHQETLRFALVWQPEPGSLAELPALEVVFSIGAGIDHLKGENIVPEGIPIVRMVQDSLTSGMVEYVTFHILAFHRNMYQYARDQNSAVWQPSTYPLPKERTVGILGLGVLGGAVGEALNRFGFNIIGWSRSEKSIANIHSYYGNSQLDTFLKQTDYLVCLLPNTSETVGILNQITLSCLPKGAYIINAGRGTAVVDDDLIAALRSGHIAGAALDVFNDEPLSPDHAYWQMENVFITPHIASMTHPEGSAAHVARNIDRYLDGKPLTHLADLKRGY